RVTAGASHNDAMARRHVLSPLLVMTLSLTACAGEDPRPDLTHQPYPDTRTVDQADDYFGTTVADPYRWLEDDNAPETEAWVEAQNRVTFDYLEQIPSRDEIRQRLTELWNYERFG